MPDPLSARAQGRDEDEWVPGPPESVHPHDPLVNGTRWRLALERIRDADPIDLVLDPTWAQDVARGALGDDG